MTRGITICLVLAALAAPTLADRVTLTDGRVLTGIVTEDATRVTIETSLGTVSFLRTQVLSIERGDSVESQYQQRLAAVTPDDSEALADLAVAIRPTKRQHR
jgi:hypothetical protein